MKKYIKRILYCVVLLALTAYNAAAMASEENSNALLYDVSQGSLTVNYSVDLPQSAFADILVLPYGCDRGALSAESIEKDTMLLKTAYTLRGVISDTILFHDGFQSGAYIVYVECGESVDRGAFIFPSDALDTAVSAVNAGQMLTNADFGADAKIFSENQADISQLLANQKPSSGFDGQSFLNAYLSAEGLARLRSGALTTDEFADLYEAYFADVLNDHESWTEKKKSSYAEVLQTYTIGSQTPADILKEAGFATECRTASDIYKLTEIILGYICDNDLSYGQYNALNEYYKNLAFSELYNKIENLNSAEEIYDQFISICRTQYDAVSKAKPNGGYSGGSGGGGSSGGAYGFDSESSANAGISMPSQPEAVFLTDISGHWGESYIEECYRSGIITGFGDNSFQPDRNVTRAEVTALLTRLLKLDVGEYSGFSDVMPEAWYYPYVAGSYHSGLITGYDGCFKPEESITRQDMAVIIFRALTKQGGELSGETSFADGQSIAEYAAESVVKLAANGVITGYENLFRPMEFLTRAEAAAMICRVNNILTEV